MPAVEAASSAKSKWTRPRLPKPRRSSDKMHLGASLVSSKLFDKTSVRLPTFRLPAEAAGRRRTSWRGSLRKAANQRDTTPGPDQTFARSVARLRFRIGGNERYRGTEGSTACMTRGIGGFGVVSSLGTIGRLHGTLSTRANAAFRHAGGPLLCQRRWIIAPR